MTRHQAFHDLHQHDCCVVSTPWDAGSARMTALGAKALAKLPAGHVVTRGRADKGTSRVEAHCHAELMVAVTDLPVSGEFENGFGDKPETVAKTVRLARIARLTHAAIAASVSAMLYEGRFAPLWGAALGSAVDELLRMGAASPSDQS